MPESTKVTMSFPHLITVELPENKKVVPFAGVLPPVLVKKVEELAFRGVTHRDGTWRINPNEWKIEKLGIGEYKIIHNLGYENLSLSISLLVQPGSFLVKEHTPTYFVVETVLDTIPTDLDFSFTLARVIYQSVQQ